MGIFDRLTDQLGELIVPDEVRPFIDRATALTAQGDLDGAERELRAALAQRPDHARAALLLGGVLERQGSLDAAEAALVLATTAREDLVEAHLALGDLRRKLGRTEAAGEAYRRALEAGPADVALRGEIHRGLGAVHLALGRGDKAVRELRKAAALLPGDVEVQGLLGRALVARGDLDTARVCLERAASAPQPDDAALLALGELYRRIGRFVDAEMAFLRAQQLRASARARVGLAQARLDLGDVPGALSHARAAVEEAAREGRPREAARMLARALAASGDPTGALAALDVVLHAPTESGDEAERLALLDEALHIALRGDLDERAAGYAAPLRELRPHDADAIAALALGKVATGDLLGADALLGLVTRSEDATVETQLAAARVRAAQGQTAAAAVALRRAVELAPRDPRARARLASVYQTGREAAPTDLYGLLRVAQRQLVRVPELADLGPEAARVVEILDRPLLVTVMGEFNSGKSTFVNAFVGEEVAPMGIVPTTATINVLKYGAERGARVVYRDDTVRDVPWAEVPALLRGLDADEARLIRMVEIRYPLETLQRVNVVDTPGLNSILPEHEETAREFIASADAVLWLFTCGQAGTASEHEALERVRAAQKKVVGVVNKIDRVDEAERKEVLAHLEGYFSDVVEALVPFSAKEALYGRNDPERLARSNRAALDTLLEERFFARAQIIKRGVAVRRLSALLDEARARGARLLGERGELSQAIETAMAAVRADQLLWSKRFILEERQRLRVDLDALLGGAAREVLDFVRPRRWAFGSNQAAPADRDFLVALVEEKLGGLGDASRARVATETERVATAVRRGDPAASATEAELRVLDLEVYGRYRAFSRGYLRGGRVDDFFTRVLPKLEPTEPAIRRALELNLVDAELIDVELAAPLKGWGEHFFAGLLARLERLAQREGLRRFEVEERLIQPVEILRHALESHAS